MLLAEIMRFSVFTPAVRDHLQVPVDAWWHAITGSSPEQIARSGANTFSALAEGPFSNGRLAVAASPGRVDCQLAPALPTAAPREWPNLGTWPECLDALVSPVRAWLPAIQPIARLAFGVIIAKSVADRPTGYRQIESALSELQIRLPSDLSDFLIQLNRPIAASHAPGMTINRLSRWGVALLAPVMIQLAVVLPNVQMQTPQADAGLTRQQLHALRVELDFNTAAEWTQPIAPESAQALLDELTDLARNYVTDHLS